MNYPVWDVPIVGSAWVIGAIASFHVLVSHFAIGGGFYLPIAERKALREGRADWLEVIKGHSRFFMVLTAAFGTVTGVGIWFAIGLGSSEGTSTLIHNFVFGWAIEYCFFLVEVTAAMVYYYTWGRVSDRMHLAIGWIYAGSAWMSLVVINGILTFMLTPGAGWLGVAGTGAEASQFWHAIINPTYFPSLALRTLICVSLAGIWAFITASRIDGASQPQLKTDVMRWTSKWLIPSFVLLPLCFAWYLYNVPAENRGLLELGIKTIGQGVFTQVTRTAVVTVMTSATICVIVYLLAWRTPLGFNFGHACALLLLAMAATASTEYAREMLRKPYVVNQHMYSNGTRKSQVDAFNREGYLTRSVWVRPEERALWQGGDSADPKVQAAHMARGELMFRGQCMACHTVDGYRSMRTLLQTRDRLAIGNILTMLHENKDDSPYKKFMPPLTGLPEEITALGDYLNQLVHGADSKNSPPPAPAAAVPAAK
jgi:cytochrome bd-type quinol oxidase subunit 1/mono/diheme cytochrome c family protein